MESSYADLMIAFGLFWIIQYFIVAAGVLAIYYLIVWLSRTFIAYKILVHGSKAGYVETLEESLIETVQMQQQLKDVTENSDGMSTADYDDEEYFDCVTIDKPAVEYVTLLIVQASQQNHDNNNNNTTICNSLHEYNTDNVKNDTTSIVEATSTIAFGAAGSIDEDIQELTNSDSCGTINNQETTINSHSNVKRNTKETITNEEIGRNNVEEKTTAPKNSGNNIQETPTAITTAAVEQPEYTQSASTPLVVSSTVEPPSSTTLTSGTTERTGKFARMRRFVCKRLTSCVRPRTRE